MTYGPIKIIRPGANVSVAVQGPRGFRGAPGSDGEAGETGPAAFYPVTPWVSGFQYLSGPPTHLVTIGGSAYACAGSHISGVFTADLALGYWTLLVSVGANGATWYSGSGGPSAGVGANGDFYLRTDTSDIYNKAAGAWGSPVLNIKGPAGATLRNGSGAPSNSIGADGDFYIDTANTRIYGPKASGAWPSSSTSLIGTGAGSVNPSGTFVVGNVVVAGTTDGEVIQDGGFAPASATSVAALSKTAAYLLCLSM